MEVKINSPQDWLREIEIEIESDRLKDKVKSALDEIAPKAELPGFRKGKVPRAILERRLTESVEQSAAQELAEEAILDALKQQDWRPASEPEMTGFELRPDKSISLKMSIEILPEFELGEYKGLPVKKNEPAGFDDEMERRARELQERCATYHPVSGAAAEGQFVIVDWRTFDGDEEVAEPRTNLMLEIGDPMNFEEVNKGLLGVKPGEERTIEATVPADYPDKKLAGRTISFRFAIREVKEKRVPVLDEDLALSLGYDSLDEVREELNKSIMVDRERLIANDIKNQIFDHLLNACKFNPPESWVKLSYSNLREQYDLPDDDETRKKLTEVATRRARFDVIIDRIARAENITVSQEEVNEQVRILAERTKRPVEDVGQLLDNPAFRVQILREKVMSFLRKHAMVSAGLLGADGRPVASSDKDVEEGSHS